MAEVKKHLTEVKNVLSDENSTIYTKETACKKLEDLFTSQISAEDVTLALQVVILMLRSGRAKLIKTSLKTLEAMTKSKSLTWKDHTGEAGKMLNAIADIQSDQIQDDSNSSLRDSVDEYCNLLEKLLQMFKKGKILPKIQPELVDMFFVSMYTDTTRMLECGYKCSEFLDFSKSPKLRLEALKKWEKLMLEMEPKGLHWQETRFNRAVEKMMEQLLESYKSGSEISAEENKLFMSIFTSVSVGDDSIEEHFYQEDNEDIPQVKLSVWQSALCSYASLHEESNTLAYLAPLMPELLKWAKIALEDNNKAIIRLTFDPFSIISHAPTVEFSEYLPDMIDLMLISQKCRTVDTFITTLYPHNPEAVHGKMQDIFEHLDTIKDSERSYLLMIINEVAQQHPEVFTKSQIRMLLDQYPKVTLHEKNIIVIILKHTSEKHPSVLVDFFPQFCDDSFFPPETLNFRRDVIVCVGGVNKELGQKAIDYLMKFTDYSDGMIAHYILGSLHSMVRKHKDYMQKYKSKLEKARQSATVPQARDLANNIILVIEGKSVEKIAEDVQQQQEDMADIDEKVDATVETVISIGEKVIEHDQEIGEIGEGLERIEERVDDVDTDLTETKIKVEEIDNKTISNAPKWSRDLTKLMNPCSENDWRLLASRLGYSNDDIRGWATQHDPCMALLSEWYATHKTREASFSVFTALTEMNRMDGVAIVENAMKAAEGLVEDEDFEYPSPPQVFISYQWGFQNKVKLLKQHLNMAGYECWMDIGQMGGGDKLFSKIDNGIRGAKVVICCVTEKYAQSPNCNREVNLSVTLNKPIIPLLMEKMDWPPEGSMGPIFSEYLFIRFFQRSGEETKDNDQRYWSIPKFQELLMQLNFFAVPDQSLVQKEYTKWWAPMIEDIVVDKSKGKKQTTSSVQSSNQTNSKMTSDESPLVFLSYQWGKQPQIKALYKRLTSLGYTVWMDIYQMGGGDSLYDKIDRGMRGCKAVVSCVTQKYSLSANCRREISLADALKKPIIPVLLENIKWPPDGPMSMVFTELLFINFYRDEAVQMTWRGEKFEELIGKIEQFIPATKSVSSSQKSLNGKKMKGLDPSPGNQTENKRENFITNSSIGGTNRSENDASSAVQKVISEPNSDITGKQLKDNIQKPIGEIKLVTKQVKDHNADSKHRNDRETENEASEYQNHDVKGETKSKSCSIL